MAKCHKCGCELTGTEKFCSECGVPQKEAVATSDVRLSGIYLSGGVFGFSLDISEGEALFYERFVIKSRIGSGGFGQVYLAKDKTANHLVALKVVPTIKGEEVLAADQLRNEINLRRRITNFKHIIQVNDIYVDPDFKGRPLVLLSMEYAEGGSLRSWIKSNKEFLIQEDKRKEAIKYFREACLGVKTIHNAGLIHLDLKPENLLLMEGRVKVSDLGLSRNYIQYAQNLEVILKECGTPSYMSPEQFKSARQKDINYQSDNYTLGIILFELLDGDVPFDGSFEKLKAKHLNQKPSSLSGVLAPWDPIVVRCLAKEPSKRYTSVDELLDDLDSAARGDFLSVDVACNKCGHINAIKELKQCQQCGLNISHLFRRCPNCHNLNRLDVDICPPDKLGCGYDVGRHYRVEDLLKKAHQLRDVDPLETIKALVEVLELDKGNGEAKEILSEVRLVQEKIEEIVPEAEADQKKGRLEEARSKWQDILSLAMRHQVAMAKKQELDDLIDRYNADYERSFDLMDQGKFFQARGFLEGCRKLVPPRRETDEALKVLNRREQLYNEHFENAKSLSRQKRLNSAKRELKLCLEKASRSKDLSKLKLEVDKRVAVVGDLFSEAKGLLARASFERVKRTIKQIEDIQIDLSGFQKFKKEMLEKENRYSDLLEKWSVALKPEIRDLDGAQKDLEEALKICPKSTNFRTLEKVVEEKDKAFRLIEEAKLSIRTAEFAKARDKIRDAERIWRHLPQLPAVKKRLETRQTTYTKYLDAAMKLYEKKELASALEQLEAATKICPESEDTQILKNVITANQKQTSDLIDKAKSLIPKADFSNAFKNINDAEKLWAKAPHLLEIKDKLEITHQNFVNDLNKALNLYEEKKLVSALENAELAIATCMKSNEAQNLINKIESDKKLALGLVDNAANFIHKADFRNADRKIKEAEMLWATAPQLLEIKEKLEVTHRNYVNNFNKALNLYKEKKLVSALENAELALAACIKSNEAQNLINKIESDKKLALGLVDNAANFIHKADFRNADRKIKEAEMLWATAPQLLEIKEKLEVTHRNYVNNFNKALNLYKEKKLVSALENAELALAACIKSNEAQNLINKIESDKKLALGLVDNAANFIHKADFRNADRKIKEAEMLWINAPKINGVKIYINEIERKYQATVHEIKGLIEKKKLLIVAMEKTLYALSLCPLASEAIELEKTLKTLIERQGLVKRKKYEIIYGTLIISLIAVLIYFSQIQHKKAFTPKMSVLYVNVQPKNAKIRLIDIVSKYQPGVELEPGIYNIEVSAPGFKKIKRWIKLADGETKKYSIKLEQDKRKLDSKSFSNGFGMKFVYINPGTFMMGNHIDKRGRYDNEPQVKVNLTKGFYMQTTEITMDQWFGIMGETIDINLNFGWEDNFPVRNINWKDVQKFIKKLNTIDGSSNYRLPSEAEWEYACRAGSKSSYFFGEDENLLTDYAWVWKNSDGKPHQVGKKKPNNWGLYDMYGNVYEYCQDWYSFEYPKGPISNPAGPSQGKFKVVRGCSYSSELKYFCTSYYRGHMEPNLSALNFGFRLVRNP